MTNALPEARAQFVRRTYTHLAFTVLALLALEYGLLSLPGIGNLAALMTGGFNWLVVLGLFMVLFEEEEEPALRKLDDGAYTMDGGVSIREANEALGSNFASEDFDTVGGLILEHLGRASEVGDKVFLDGYVLRVESIDDLSANHLRIHVLKASTTTSKKPIAGSKGLSETQISISFGRKVSLGACYLLCCWGNQRATLLLSTSEA